jgi:hypothetical protein
LLKLGELFSRLMIERVVIEGIPEILEHLGNIGLHARVRLNGYFRHVCEVASVLVDNARLDVSVGYIVLLNAIVLLKWTDDS